MKIDIFSHQLITWYEESHRALPWRNEIDPYKIWVSEIILQQTRVIQGLNYYLRFIEKFPDIASLAQAEEVEVLQLWQGLGYYSRARNMHTAAREIIQRHQGIFPNKYEDIIRLKGIGKYTAAAISSIAFKLPYPAIDGNVLRVVSRILGVFDDISSPKTYKIIEEQCQKWIKDCDAGIFNQAMMELGATCCKPKQFTCELCPVSENCFALANDAVNKLPIKINKVKIKTRYFHFFLFIRKNKIIIEQRQQKDIWKALFQFPLIETETPCEKPAKNLLLQTGFNHPENLIFVKEIIHQLTHQKLIIRFYQTDEPIKLQKGQQQIPIEELTKYPFPVALQIFSE